MHLLKLALFMLPLVTEALAITVRYPIKHRKPRPHHLRKKSSYHGPGAYYIENQATGTALDLYNGDPGPDTLISA